MNRAKPKTILLVLLLAAVILGALATFSFYAYRAYEERKNYERTANSYVDIYLYFTISILEVVYIEEGEYAKTPIDLQAMIDDLHIVPPPNPYRKDRKTVFTTIDKWVPGAILYVPGPVEIPDLYASGLFGGKQDSGRDFITKGDDPWIIGWGLSKPDGIPDGTQFIWAYGQTDPGDRKPLENPSPRWEKEFRGSLHWKYPDGTKLSSMDDEFSAMFEDYYRRHPENFAAEKRPRMPKGFTISKEDAASSYLPEHVRAFYKKLYGYDPVIGDEKAKE